MEQKLPTININKKFIKLKLKNEIKENPKKLDKIMSIIAQKNRRKKLYQNYDLTNSNQIFKYNNLKGISLSRLIKRQPKKLNDPAYKTIDQKKLSEMHHSRKLNQKMLRNSSVQFFPTGSTLNRLLVENKDNETEIKKFKYYEKIEKSKSYKEFLKKERDIIPKDSVNNSFMEDSKINQNNEYKKNFNLLKQKPSIYDLLYLFNPKNMFKLKTHLDNKEKFEKFIIEKFIRKRKKNLEMKDELDVNKRYIYIILDGEYILNENYINGFFMEIPYYYEINRLNEKQKKLILNNILKKSQKIFNTKNPLINIFSPEKEYIDDPCEIKESFEFLYVSMHTVCYGASIIITPSLLNTYDKKFRKDLNKTFFETPSDSGYMKYKKKFKRKIKEINYGIKLKYEKFKPHYSFAEGEDDIENVDYIMYSDNEERKQSIEKNIVNNCILKNDFFLLSNEKEIKDKTSILKQKFNFVRAYNLREQYKKQDENLENLLCRYRKEIYQQLKINPKIFKVDPIDSKINSHNLEFPNDKLTKLYISRKSTKKKEFEKFQKKYLMKNNKYHFKNSPLSYDPFYHNLHRDVTQFYNPLILSNIPNLLAKFKNFSRQKIYELYAKYKDIITMSYSKYKSKFILENGVDFETFWRCIDIFSDVKKEFVYKIYNQINQREVCFLNKEDFLSGMYYMQNSDLSKKLDLFLKMLDKYGKGEISFNEAVSVCKESIQRSFGEKINKGENDEEALDQMSEFFAGFVFKVLKIDKKSNLKIDDLRKAFISKENEINDFEYLEMFCGVNI